MSDLSPIKLIAEFERFIRRDPAGRGLIATESQFGPLCSGHLATSAESLATTATGVVLVTGFFIPHAELPAAETDGPLGTALLAAVLQHIGIPSLIVTDSPCFSAVKVAAEAMDFPANRVGDLSDDPCGQLQALVTGYPELSVSHLIAVERAGPSHTVASIREQSSNHPQVVSRFRDSVPEQDRGRCHNMRGDVIDEHTAPLHRLFEEFPHRVSIGIGDGGNEIGMGTILWDDLCRRLPGEHAPRIPCRIRTDRTIVAGVSNWGAQALAASVAVLRDRIDVLEPWDCDQQEQLLEFVIHNGPAVDGITGRREPTVDGLPFITYIQPWAGMRRLLGLKE